MQMTQTLLLLDGQFEIDAVFEVTHFEEDVEVTDVYFEYVTFYPIDFDRRSDDIDQKLYDLIEAAAKDNFDLNKAEALCNA